MSKKGIAMNVRESVPGGALPRRAAAMAALTPHHDHDGGQHDAGDPEPPVHRHPARRDERGLHDEQYDPSREQHRMDVEDRRERPAAEGVGRPASEQREVVRRAEPEQHGQRKRDGHAEIERSIARRGRSSRQGRIHRHILLPPGLTSFDFRHCGDLLDAMRNVWADAKAQFD